MTARRQGRASAVVVQPRGPVIHFLASLVSPLALRPATALTSFCSFEFLFAACNISGIARCKRLPYFFATFYCSCKTPRTPHLFRIQCYRKSLLWASGALATLSSLKPLCASSQHQTSDVQQQLKPDLQPLPVRPLLIIAGAPTPEPSLPPPPPPHPPHTPTRCRPPAGAPPTRRGPRWHAPPASAAARARRGKRMTPEPP